jgi:hypothetical protein
LLRRWQQMLSISDRVRRWIITSYGHFHYVDLALKSIEMRNWIWLSTSDSNLSTLRSINTLMPHSSNTIRKKA